MSKDPLTFKLVRFLNEEVNVRGQDFRLFPFSFGRRGCAGTSLGLEMVSLLLYKIVSNFKLHRPSGWFIDLPEESWGLTLHKKNPLFLQLEPLVANQYL